VPTQFKYEYEIESSSNEDSAEGVRKMRGRFYDQAIELFNAAIAKDGSDHKSWFALGLVYELTGRYDDAMNAYRQAASAKGVDQDEAEIYSAAGVRLERHAPRIIRK